MLHVYLCIIGVLVVLYSIVLSILLWWSRQRYIDDSLPLVRYPQVTLGNFPSIDVKGINFTNPTIVANPSQPTTFTVVLRGVNYIPEVPPSQWLYYLLFNLGKVRHGIRTRNFASRCTTPDLLSWTNTTENTTQRQWSVAPQEVALTCDTKDNKCLQGYEDARLFYYQNQLYFTATTFHLGGTGISLVSLDEHFTITRVLPLCPTAGTKRCRHGDTIQKNWIPFLSHQHADTVCVITHWSPIFKLYHLNMTSGELMLVLESQGSTNMRGSSPPIWHPDLGWVAITHTRDKRGMYWHYFIQFDETQGIQHVSAPFRFEGKFKIEFCTSFVALDLTTTLIAYSVTDSTSQFLYVPWTLIQLLLHRD